MQRQCVLFFYMVVRCAPVGLFLKQLLTKVVTLISLSLRLYLRCMDIGQQ